MRWRNRKGDRRLVERSQIGHLIRGRNDVCQVRDEWASLLDTRADSIITDDNDDTRRDNAYKRAILQKQQFVVTTDYTIET